MTIDKQNKTYLYTISDDYIDKLKDKDYRVQNNYNGQRVYFKVDIKSGTANQKIDYYVPLSSPKKHQLKINNKSQFKMFGDREKMDFLGVLHLNNLIPVPKEKVKKWNAFKASDNQYNNLIIKQAKYIHAEKNKINADAQIIYDSKTSRLDRDYFKKNRKDVMIYKRITSDLNELEKVYIEENRNLPG